MEMIFIVIGDARDEKLRHPYGLPFESPIVYKRERNSVGGENKLDQ